MSTRCISFVANSMTVSVIVPACQFYRNS